MTTTIGMLVNPPGLRGLNRLATRLNDLMARRLISDWHLGRWADSTKTWHGIVFESAKDAEEAAKGDAVKGAGG